MAKKEVVLEPAPAEAAGAPKVIDPTLRAPAGWKRFKVRADNVQGFSAKYVLAKNEADAKGCYAKAMNLDATAKRLSTTDHPFVAEYVVTELPD
jgi:hypothetical protein